MKVLLIIAAMMMFSTVATAEEKAKVKNVEKAAVEAVPVVKTDATNAVAELNTPAEIVWKKGDSLYEGEVPTLNQAMFVDTPHGAVPIVIFCKADVDSYGMNGLYFDQMTDDEIRYRRLPTRSTYTNGAPGIIFNPKGDFQRTEGAIPPSDCMKKNLFKILPKE